jgi:putative NADH-flavin reductase
MHPSHTCHVIINIKVLYCIALSCIVCSIAIVRDASKIKAQDGVTVVTGDVLKDDIAPLIKSADVVVSGYSPGYTEVTPLLDFTKRLIAAVQPNQRVLFTGGAGGLQVPDGTLVINQSWFPDGNSN